MGKNDLIQLLDEIFVPLGFTRKGNNWALNGSELSKLVNLQKSNYSNSFYINYGYVLKSVPLSNERTHVESRLASIDKEEQKLITDLLDLETETPTERRSTQLKRIINYKIADEIQSVNTERELLEYLKKRPHLNDISLTVKRHFNLSE